MDEKKLAELEERWALNSRSPHIYAVLRSDLRALIAAAHEGNRLREIVEHWGMLYNTPPIVTGEDWNKAHTEAIGRTLRALEEEDNADTS